MNIREINNGTPTWSAVVIFGLPLALVTVALPLGFGYVYRKVTQFAVRSPKLFRFLAWGVIGGGGIAIVIIIVILIPVVSKNSR